MPTISVRRRRYPRSEVALGKPDTAPSLDGAMFNPTYDRTSMMGAPLVVVVVLL